MKTLLSLLALNLVLCVLPVAAAAPPDLSSIRGFGYNSASVEHYGFWTQMNPAEVDRDFGYANLLKLNAARISVRYADWEKDPVLFARNFGSFMDIAAKHHIGVMLTLAPPAEYLDGMSGQAQKDADAKLKVWALALLKLARGKTAIQFWDVANEPDWTGYLEKPKPEADRQHRLQVARDMANLVHAENKNYLTTVGCFRESCMELMAPYTDVLSYHDYSPTVAEIDAIIVKAKAFAATVHKPLVQTEMGCIGRGNPYDVVLREYQKAGIGFYAFELMVTKFWGDIHGVFYPDGTVRDPAIPMALMGVFRKTDADFRLESPDRESWVTRAVTRGKEWLANPNPDWNKGLETAELAANMLQGNQLIAMREPPVRTVAILRAGAPDMAALKNIMRQYVAALEPYVGMGKQHGN
ncbi:MAG TPA: hypothetical protein VGM26_13760 [Rhizomicrobium sp.]|jgi:hypothetical protein